MPQREVPSSFFFRNGHLKTSSQQAPQRLHSPRRNASAAIVSSLRKFVMTKRRSLPWAWRARSFASATLRKRIRLARRVSNGRDLLDRFIVGWNQATKRHKTCKTVIVSEFYELLIQLKVLFSCGRPGIIYEHSVALDL